MLHTINTQETNLSLKALVIGVGGGGCNALFNVYKNNCSKELDFFAINTDMQALNSLIIPLHKKLLIGEELTQGFGAGANPSQGKLAAIESESLIKNYIKKDYQIVFILSGMGGGTGTGASPVVARICKELGILTIAVISTPFSFEGNLRKKQAMTGINELHKYSDSTFLFSNDNILNFYSTVMLSDAFKYSDSIFKLPIDLILGVTMNSGYINIDFEDVKSVLRNSGFSTVSSGEGSGKNRVNEALENMLNSPFISNVDIDKATSVLIQSESGKNEITMQEMSNILDYFSSFLNKDISIIWGTAINTELNDELRLNVIFAGVTEEEIIEYSNPTDIGIEKNIPPIIQKEVENLRAENKGKKLAFLIMQFGRGKLYDEILLVLRKSLSKYNIVVLRADDKEFHDSLFYNILTYMYASDFGIALFERITDDSFNPNVAFEVGYMQGINKEVCYLKEKTLKHLHTDIIGKMYREFDIQEIEKTMIPNLEKWLEDKKIIKFDR